MTWWSVLVECSAPDDVELDVADERYDDLAEQVVAHDGAVTTGKRSYSVRVPIQSPSALAAVLDARDLLHKFVANSGLPEWGETMVESVTEDHLEQQLSRPSVPQLLGAAEVARRIGVSRQRLAKLRERRDFPQPYTELAATPVWLAPAIDSWMESR